MLQIPELLAPAGDLERLRYAINYGADAVYCALPEFGMRSAPTNFTPEQLSEGVIYAHARGRKVYLTMNTLPTNEEGNVILGDEMLTPDSSRFWPLEGYEAGHGQPSFDKQFVRNWLLANPDSDYDLPQDVIDKTIAKYEEAYEMLTGKKL